MSGPFVPAPFATPVVSPAATTLTRRVPYISPTEFANAPTAVATNNLVPGGTPAQQAAEQYNVLLRASDWVDLICFHGPDGTLAASPTVESGWITPKSQGLWLQCNMKPIMAVTGLALGPAPGNLTNVDASVLGSMSIEGTIIQLFAPFNGFAPFSSTALLAPLNRGGKTYVAWSYVAGYPHCVLAEPSVVGATTLVVSSAVPGGLQPYGIYEGSQLTIVDTDPASGTEDVVVANVSGNTLTLAYPTQFKHTPPSYPDYIAVTAIPHSVRQATISLASCLIKLRGSKAAVMASQAGGTPNKVAVAQAGAGTDLSTAMTLLKPFTTVYRRNSSA